MQEFDTQSNSLNPSESNIPKQYNKEQSEEVGNTIVNTMSKVQEIILKADNKDNKKTDDPQL